MYRLKLIRYDLQIYEGIRPLIRLIPALFSPILPSKTEALDVSMNLSKITDSRPAIFQPCFQVFFGTNREIHKVTHFFLQTILGSLHGRSLKLRLDRVISKSDQRNRDWTNELCRASAVGLYVKSIRYPECLCVPALHARQLPFDEPIHFLCRNRFKFYRRQGPTIPPWKFLSATALLLLYIVLVRTKRSFARDYVGMFGRGFESRDHNLIPYGVKFVSICVCFIILQHMPPLLEVGMVALLPASHSLCTDNNTDTENGHLIVGECRGRRHNKNKKRCKTHFVAPLRGFTKNQSSCWRNLRGPVEP